MSIRLSSLLALELLAGVVVASAQPGQIITSNNTNLVFAASTLLTNGIPGLSGSPVGLMVATVQSNSAQGGGVSLVASQQWARRYNGPANNEDQAMDVIADNDGNIIAAGYSVGSGSGQDFLTIKYSPSGVGLWTNRHNGPGNGSDQIRSVAVDGSGAVYVAGDSEGITTIKYAADGTPVWTNTYSSSAMFMFFTGLAVDNDGNAFIATVDADSDAYVTIKYDVNGNPAWTNFFRSSPTSQESASDIAVDAVGNIFLTGYSFDGGGSCLTLKYASDGSVLWTNHYSTEGNGGSGTRVIVDQQGNVVVAVDLHSIYGNKYSVIKFSNSGTMLWSNVVNAVNYAGGGVPGIAADVAGNVFLVGGTPGVKYSSAGVPLWTNRFVDPNSGTQEFDGAGTDNAGNLYLSVASASPGGANYNYVTVKYSANGAAVWTNRYNGPANSSDLPRGMTVDKAGGVYVTGTSSSGGTSFGALDWATLKYADNVRYAPTANFVGQDTITFTAFDSLGNSATGLVVIVVLPGPTAVVAPDDFTSIAGNTSLNTIIRGTNLPRTYQMQFTPDALGGLPTGARITGLRFRLGANAAVSFPEATLAWSDYEVRLAQSANPIVSMSTIFSANLLNPVLVKDGLLSIAANNYGFGGNPNPFSTLMALDTPYVYQGGDLVMHFTHTGSNSTNTTFLDAASSAAPGYGISFRTISANAFAAAIGAAASVTIVEIVYTPTITQTITRSGNQIVINGTGGSVGATYRILTATNVALPGAQWTPITTNQFGAGGGFSYTNAFQPNRPARYFRVSMP
jgi:hypothetical protein